MDARSSAAARARAWACTSAPARSRCAAPSPATCSRCASSTSRLRPCANPHYAGKSLRQQRRRVVGLPLQGPARRSRSRARSSRSTRSTPRASATGPRPSTTSAGRRRPIPFGVVHTTIDYPGVPVDHAHRQGEARRPQERARADPAALRRDGPGAPPRPTSSTRSRPATSAATSTTGASARAPRCTTRWRCRGRCSRRATPHASQGDSELCGTAIECSLTGTFQLILHKRRRAGRHAARGPRLPAARDAGRVGRPRLQLPELPRRARRRTRRPRSTRSPRSTWRCATPSARCATS